MNPAPERNPGAGDPENCSHSLRNTRGQFSDFADDLEDFVPHFGIPTLCVGIMRDELPDHRLLLSEKIGASER
jgi:hypothetical protein